MRPQSWAAAARARAADGPKVGAHNGIAANPTRASRTGGQLIVDQLLTHGAELAFCVPGESYLPVLAPAFERALAAGKPALIEIRIDPEAITPNATLQSIRTAAQKQESR